MSRFTVSNLRSPIPGKGNLDIIDAIFTSNYLAHSGSKDYTGHKFIRQFIGQLCKAIPDLKVVKVEILFQADDKIAWQRTLRGTHEEDLMGAPASGQKVEWCDMVVSRFENDKIAEEWVVSDLAGQLLSKPPR